MWSHSHPGQQRCTGLRDAGRQQMARCKRVSVRTSLNAFFSKSDCSRAIPSMPSFFYLRAIRFAFFLPQTRSVRLLWLCFDQNARRYWTASHAHLFTVFEKLYSPWEVAYNNTKQYKHKQDRTDRTEKKRHATCTIWRKWWWRWWWQKLPSTVAHSFLRG